MKFKLWTGLCLLISQLMTLSLDAQPKQNPKEAFQQLRSAEHAAVLLGHHPDLLPIKNLENRSIVAVHLEENQSGLFDSIANLYAPVASLSAKPYQDSADLYNLEDDLQPYNTVIVTLTADGLSDYRNQLYLQDISKRKAMIVVILGAVRHPLSIHLSQLKCPVLYMPTHTSVTASVAAQIVFGGIAVNGKLKKPLGPDMPAGKGNTTSAIRLKYTYPEELGISSESLHQIDQLAAEAIAKRATPGMVVLAARKGKVFFHKAYGFHTYYKKCLSN
ncbi:hypothetical protein FSB73_05105 [Arachidicoccus ginsenosidivorans]|uniref:Glycoside hydrolase family 3 C-terminal domain-containing protein n=1 Tax=Arachidicoccus ginsenosidivorans TaxID=496057 RepID=A0A5B8VHT1_9BACT|nr:hypothetical protein [Arachidicoccus ginsenosidivorans]QEC71147.1 hypothetical protein FSB73_05105 [Arachidicoccus ginsenosidivorans]